jgi:hypothetical protein
MIPTYHIKVCVCCSLHISTPLYPFQPCHDGRETLETLESVHGIQSKPTFPITSPLSKALES